MKTNKMKNTKLLLFFGLMAILTLSGCAHSPNVQACIPVGEHIYGFWGGAWHGFIMSFSFIGSLFSNNIVVYAVNNNGGWYDFGFVGGFWLMLRIAGRIVVSITTNN